MSTLNQIKKTLSEYRMDDAERYREQRRLAHLALKQLYKSNNDYKKLLKVESESDEEDGAGKK